ncbi:MAG: hypothetical protein WD625_01815 [Balneolales bacterium]
MIPKKATTKYIDLPVPVREKASRLVKPGQGVNGLVITLQDTESAVGESRPLV